jgi:hypothetical protein
MQTKQTMQIQTETETEYKRVTCWRVRHWLIELLEEQSKHDSQVGRRCSQRSVFTSSSLDVGGRSQFKFVKPAQHIQSLKSYRCSTKQIFTEYLGTMISVCATPFVSFRWTNFKVC